jgi:Nif-specific regulatory protein
LNKKIGNTEDLFEFAKILGQQTNFQEVVRLVANKSSQLLKADLALILMLNPDTRKTVKTIFKEGKSIEQKEYRDIHIHVGGWIIQNQKPFFSPHIQRDERFVKGLFDKVPLKSVAGVPLIIEGVIIGALIMLYLDISEYTKSNLIESLENIAAVSVPYLRNIQKLKEYFGSALPQTSLLIKYNNVGLFGESLHFIEVLHAVEAAAKCDARVLLIGNTGTGKELIAKAVHQFSRRDQNPFIAVDCGAIPDKLIESELFGHTRGAFTGAHSDRPGLFLEANGGTLFMDEINNLPLDMQSKLLRVLEQGEVRPVGSDKVVKTDVRIIAASSVPLKQLVRDKLFREDLFFRLHVYPIYIPDLSERRDDIVLLATHFLQKYVEQQSKNAQNFHEEVIDFIKKRSWDGNIRELENFVERLVTLAPENETVIDANLFPNDLKKELDIFREKQKHRQSEKPLKKHMQDYESQIIKETLIECNWNQSEAARRLDTSEKNIRYKMEKLGIRRPD